MDQLMVMFQCWAGSADDDFFFWTVAETFWQLHEVHDGDIDGLGSKIGPKPSPGYTIGKPMQRAFDWCY